MKQQLFGLTREMLDLSEHFSVNCLGEDCTSDCRGLNFSGKWASGLHPWTERVCRVLTACLG